MITESFLEELKYRSSIEQVVSNYVNLKQKGRHMGGICPFHSEKTPSFVVYPDTQSFYCFGCGAGGNVINFISRIENLEFMETLRFLADRAGMQIPMGTIDDSATLLKTNVLDINRQTARYFHNCLVGDPGGKAMGYLLDRGLLPKTLKKFGIGFAPDSWDELIHHLKSLGFSLENMAAAGIISQGKNGGYYSQFRNRIIFPIIDLRGNVVAFGGRLLDGTGPKYLNSSDTPVFKKSRNLFALNIAKSTKEGSLILAEGYMDVVAMHQAGFNFAVATLGTALTSEQSRLISTYAKRVVIAYDSDDAGQTATKRAIDILGQIGLDVRVLSIPKAKDPDEFIKKFGADRFAQLLTGSAGSTEFEIAKIRERYDTSIPDGKVLFARDFVQYIAKLPNAVERDVYLSKIATELDVEKISIQNQLNYYLKKKSKQSEKDKQRELKVFAEHSDLHDFVRSKNLTSAVAEERLLTILLKNPNFYNKTIDKISPEQFIVEQNKKIATALFKLLQENNYNGITSLSLVLNNDEMAIIGRFFANSSGINYTSSQLDEYIKIILEYSQQRTDKQIGDMDDRELMDYIQKIGNKKAGGRSFWRLAIEKRCLVIYWKPASKKAN